MKNFILQCGQRRSKSTFSILVLLSAVIGYSSVTHAGATFKIDDTKWLSIGAGLRTSFRTQANGSAGGDNWSNSFNLDNIRLYLNAQVHEYIKIEFNTDCQTCSNGGQMRILDAIGKFELDPMYNLWIGRQLVPAERREMNGPFYSSIYNVFNLGTPFEPSDTNLVIDDDGNSAGSFGRDDGVNIWGAFFEGRFQYVAGFFRGLRGGANQDNNILYAQRIAYNFLEVEKNPGYYTSGTYYGQGGDILTLAVSNQYQQDGAGTTDDPGNFRGTTVDVLFEKVLPWNGVFTFNGEYKNYNISDGFSQASRDNAPANGENYFGLFEGNAFDVHSLYLFPKKVWIGRFQPYARYVGVYPTTSSDRYLVGAGVNYVIDGHNAMVALSWQYGDLLTKGTDYTSDASGNPVNAITIGVQLQI